MLEKRLIFTLLFQNGSFMLSRNFSLQKVGDLNWVRENYDFDAIAYSIDELIILNVERDKKDLQKFSKVIEDIGKKYFMPIATGGGIRCIKDSNLLLRAGADKVVINTPIFTEPELVKELVKQFGSQCVVASIDYKNENGVRTVFIENGVRPIGMVAEKAAFLAQSLGVGEIYLTSMSNDGTGQGLDLDYVSKLGAMLSVPLIISGGAGNFEHLSAALKSRDISAVSTANLFNFMSDNLTEARHYIIEAGTSLATWGKIKEGVFYD